MLLCLVVVTIQNSESTSKRPRTDVLNTLSEILDEIGMEVPSQYVAA